MSKSAQLSGEENQRSKKEETVGHLQVLRWLLSAQPYKPCGQELQFNGRDIQKTIVTC